MAPRMTKSKIYSYMRNVGRSFGYAMADSVKGMNPTVTALFKTTAEQSKDLYQSVKNFDAKSLGFEDSDLKGTLGQAVKDLKNNALEDIRTGKWYNKDRMNRYETEMAEDMFGINFDDFGDFDDFNFEDTELDEEASITEDATKATVRAMDEVGGRVSTAVSTAAIKSADYIVESNRINTKAIYGLTQAGFSQVNKGVATMNGNLQLLVSLAEPITTHIQNSALFFTKSQEYQNKSLEYLKQIAANTSPKSSNSKVSSRGKSYTDFITSDGIIDIAALFENGAKRMKENTEMVTSMLSFVPGGEKAIIKMATGSPLHFALTAAISGLFGMEDRQGNSIRKSFENFNKVLSNFSLGLLGRAKKATFGDNFFSPFLRGIRDFLLPDTGRIQKKANSGNYEKGKVDWDGISRRALTEVIPKQLGQILAILENNFGPAGDYRVYDYDKGQFKKTSAIRSGYMADRKRYAQSAGGDLFSDVRRSLQYSGMNKKVQKNYNQQIDALLDYMMVTGNYDILSDNFNFEKAGMSGSVAADLKKRIQAIRKTRGGEVKFSGLAGNVWGARTRFDSRNRNSSSVENALVDNSISRNKNAGRNLLEATDEYGLTQTEYLRRILGHVSYISKNLKNLVGVPGVGGYNNNGTQIVWQEGDWITKSSDKNTKPDATADRIAPMELNKNYDVNGAIDKATGTQRGPGFTTEEEKLLNKYGGDVDSIPDNEPLKDSIQRKIELYGLSQRISSFGSEAYQRLKNGRFGNLIQQGENDLNITTEEVTAALDKVSGALNDFVYDNKSGIYALMNTMTAGILDMVKSLIPPSVRNLISQGWQKFKSSEFGKATFSTLRNIGLSFFGRRETAGDRANRNINRTHNAFGQAVNVVNNEIVAPPTTEIDESDFYDQATSGLDDLEDEKSGGLSGLINRYYRNSKSAGFWNNYSRGSFSAKASGIPKFRPVRMSRLRSRRTQKFSGGASSTDDEAAAEPPEGDDEQFTNSLLNKIASKVSAKIFDKILGAIENIDPEKDKETTKNTIEKLMKEAGLGKGAIGAGAFIGAGASLLTGAFVGPIAGAAIGAAAGFVAKSETAQKFLFGDFEVDENGNKTDTRAGGLLNKEISNFFQKNGVATGKGTGAGMLIGTFMGSPVLGAILGASAGYISSSEKAKKYIFGDMEKGEEGLIPLSLQKTLKEKFPFLATGVGAAILLAPGPLIPKIAIGATIGSIVGKDKGEGLKKWFFGEKDSKGKRSGGFLGYINDQLFKPMLGVVDKSFNILTKKLKDVVTQGTRKIFGGLKNFLEKEGGPIGRGILNIGSKVAHLGDSVAHGIVSIAGSPFRAANKALEKKALRSGYAYRGEDNEYLTSAQRLAQYEDVIPENATEKQKAKIKAANKNKFTYQETGSALVDQYLAKLKPEDYEAAIADLEAAEKGGDVSENATIKAILENSKHRMEKLDYKSITHGIQQAKIDQAHNEKLAKEKKTEENTVEFNVSKKIPSLIERVANIADKIYDALSGNIGTVKGDNSTGQSTIGNIFGATQDISDNTADIEERVKNEAATGSGLIRRLGLSGSGITDDPQEEQDELASNEGRAEIKRRDSFLSSIATLPGIGAIVPTISNTLTSIKDYLTGNKEKKKGLFEIIKDALLGEQGLLGGILGFFTGATSIGGGVGKLLAKFSLTNLGSIAMKGLGLFALYKALHGDFDELGEKIPTGSNDPNGDNGLTNTFDKENQKQKGRRQAKNDTNGNGTNEDETAATEDLDYYTDVNNNRVRTGSENSISTDLKRNFASGLIMGKSSVVSASIKKITGIDITTKGLTKTLGNIAKDGADDLVQGICSNLGGIFRKICTALSKLPFVGKLIDLDPTTGTAQTITNKIGEYLSKVGNSAALKKAAGFLSNALVVLKVAYIAGRVIDGWGNAETILGIVDDATIGQRFIAALIAGTNAAIPFIGDLIPDKVLVDIFMSVAEQLGLEGVEGLQEQRDKATAEVQAYIDATGDEGMTIERYNQLGYTMNEDGTFTQGKARAGLLTQAKMKITGAWDQFQENGGISGAATRFGESINTLATNATDWMADKFSKVGSTIKSEIEQSNKISDAIHNTAMTGDFLGMWNIDTSSLGTEDNPVGGFQKALAFGNKIIYSIPALAIGAGKAIADFVPKVVNAIKAENTQSNQIANSIKDAAMSGDFTGMWGIDTDSFETENNPVGGFQKALAFGNKVIYSIPALAIGAGKAIADFIPKAVSAIKAENDQSNQIANSIKDAAMSGDFTGMWGIDAESLGSEENPVGGFQKALAFGNKVIYSIPALAIGAGKAVGNFVSNTVGTIKSEIEQSDKISNAIKQASNTGDIKALWDVDIDSLGTDDNPVGHIQKAMAFGNKILYTVPTLIKGVGISIGGFFDNIRDAISSDQKDLDKKNDLIKGYAEEGEIGKIWKESFTTKNDDPISGVWKAGFNINRIFQSIVGVFHKIAGPIEDVIGKVTDIYETISGTVGDWVEGAKDLAGDIADWATGGSGSGIVSQLDPKYNRYKVGGKSFAANGCGPASAVMATGGDMASAVNIAQKYQTVGGTDAAYFGEMFNRRGMKANYYLAGGSSLINDIASGKPTVLMGQDIFNRSKDNSPFGPNNHYVVANGFDGSGNLLISDPEQRGIRRYNPAILRNVKVGISGGESGTAGRSSAGRPGSSMTIPTSTTYSNKYTNSQGYTVYTKYDGTEFVHEPTTYTGSYTNSQGLTVYTRDDGSEWIYVPTQKGMKCIKQPADEPWKYPTNDPITKEPWYDTLNVIDYATETANKYTSVPGYTINNETGYVTGFHDNESATTSTSTAGSPVYTPTTSSSTSPANPIFINGTGFVDQNTDTVMSSGSNKGKKSSSSSITSYTNSSYANIYSKDKGGYGISEVPWNAENAYNENLGIWSDITAEEINEWIARKSPKSPFNGHGDIFVEAGRQSGLDPRYILAHAALETNTQDGGWGSSNFAVNRHNYFGIGAFDSNPGNAYTFSTDSSVNGMAAGIIEGAKWIAEHYYKSKYKQTSVYKMRFNNKVHQYATDPEWHSKIGSIMAGGPANTMCTLDDAPVYLDTSSTYSYADGSGDVGSLSNEEAASQSKKEKTKKEKITIGGILSTITSAFSNAFGNLFNGSTEEKVTGGNTSTGTSKSSSGQAYGTDSNGESGTGYKYDPVYYMESMKGKIKYDMKGPRNPEKGSADCSSTVNWAVKKATGIDIGSTTLAMYNNDKNLKTIWYNKGNVSPSVPFGAKRNDIFLFTRPKSDFTIGKPDRVGHVGIYTGNGKKFIEIGKGTGTYESDLSSSSGLIKVSRLTDENGNEINFLDNPYTTEDTSSVAGTSGDNLTNSSGDVLTSEDFIGQVGTDLAVSEHGANVGTIYNTYDAEQRERDRKKSDELLGINSAMGSGLLHYRPSKAGNYILRDNTRNYYRQQGAGYSGTTSQVSGGSLLEIAKGAVNRTASSAKQSGKELGAIPANVSAIRQDTNDMNATLKVIAQDLAKLLEAKEDLSASGSGLPAKKQTSANNSVSTADYAANKELQSIMESIITSAI